MDNGCHFSVYAISNNGFIEEKGVGNIFIEKAEKYARRKGKKYYKYCKAYYEHLEITDEKMFAVTRR